MWAACSATRRMLSIRTGAGICHSVDRCCVLSRPSVISRVVGLEQQSGLNLPCHPSQMQQCGSLWTLSLPGQSQGSHALRVAAAYRAFADGAHCRVSILTPTARSRPVVMPSHAGITSRWATMGGRPRSWCPVCRCGGRGAKCCPPANRSRSCSRRACWTSSSKWCAPRQHAHNPRLHGGGGQCRLDSECESAVLSAAVAAWAPT